MISWFHVRKWRTDSRARGRDPGEQAPIKNFLDVFGVAVQPDQNRISSILFWPSSSRRHASWLAFWQPLARVRQEPVPPVQGPALAAALVAAGTGTVGTQSWNRQWAAGTVAAGHTPFAELQRMSLEVQRMSLVAGHTQLAVAGHTRSAVAGHTRSAELQRMSLEVQRMSLVAGHTRLAVAGHTRFAVAGHTRFAAVQHMSAVPRMSFVVGHTQFAAQPRTSLAQSSFALGPHTSLAQSSFALGPHTSLVPRTSQVPHTWRERRKSWVLRTWELLHK